MNTRVFALIIALMVMLLAAAPTSAGVLRYQDPWSRPNGNLNAPAWQANDHDQDGIPNMYDSQGQPRELPPPAIDFPQSDRPPIRFDTYEDNWYDRM